MWTDGSLFLHSPDWKPVDSAATDGSAEAAHPRRPDA
jgi:hypothetical protein